MGGGPAARLAPARRAPGRCHGHRAEHGARGRLGCEGYPAARRCGQAARRPETCGRRGRHKAADVGCRGSRLSALRWTRYGVPVHRRRPHDRVLSSAIWVRRAAIVRSMPNTPAAVGRGITVACAQPPRQRGSARALQMNCWPLWGEVGMGSRMKGLARCGDGGERRRPRLRVSSSSNALPRAGAAAGLPPDLAMRLARVTVSGAGELAHLSPEPASVLRQNVTQPGRHDARGVEDTDGGRTVGSR